MTDAEEAWAAACELGLPVAVKPQDRDLAQGVGLNLCSREHVLAAYRAAREKSPYVMVERFARGTEHRVLVVDGRVLAVARIEPPHVVGDGQTSVAGLVEAVNRDPRRGDDHRAPLRRLKLDAGAVEVLAAQGYTPESVPPPDERVLLRRNPPYIKGANGLGCWRHWLPASPLTSAFTSCRPISQPCRRRRAAAWRPCAGVRRTAQ